MRRSAYIPIALAVLSLSALRAAAQVPLGGEFTFQGLLRENATPFNQPADFEFSLWDDPDVGQGTQHGPTLTFDGMGANPPPIAVTQGLFTVRLDFGVEVFNGEARWLQIGVRNHALGGPYTTLSPRQPLTAAPYAMQTRGLFVDDSLRVGMGTTSPQFRLDVRTTAPRAIFGQVTNPTGETHGLYGQSGSDDGQGVTGVATANSGDTIGVSGVSLSPDGFGLHGVASSNSGANVGVFGQTNSPDGYAGYFAGPSGSQNYFERSVGIGTLTVETGTRLHVVGATNAGLGNAGVVVIEHGPSGNQIAADGNNFQARNSGAAITLHLNPEGGDVTLVKDGGQVGIGTGNPAFRLDVDGRGHFTDDLGIGTPPAARLHVAGADNASPTGGGIFVIEHGPTGNQLAFDGNEVQARNGGNAIDMHLNANGGRVGVGTENADAKLHVASSGNASPTGGGIFIVEHAPSGNQVAFDGNEVQARSGGAASTLHINKGGGGVAIGTSDMPANTRLAVAGTVRCEELVVQLESEWPDYVFAPEYPLMPLEELEGHLSQVRHLPGIPPASEIASSGVSVGRLQAKTIEKVEELTLYVLQLNQELRELRAENRALQARLNVLDPGSTLRTASAEDR